MMFPVYPHDIPFTSRFFFNQDSMLPWPMDYLCPERSPTPLFFLLSILHSVTPNFIAVESPKLADWNHHPQKFEKSKFRYNSL